MRVTCLFQKNCWTARAASCDELSSPSSRSFRWVYNPRYLRDLDGEGVRQSFEATVERKRESDRKGIANSRWEWNGGEREKERETVGWKKMKLGEEREADIGYFYEKLLARRVNICMVVWASAFSPSFSFPPPRDLISSAPFLSFLSRQLDALCLANSLFLGVEHAHAAFQDTFSFFSFFSFPPIHPRTNSRLLTVKTRYFLEGGIFSFSCFLLLLLLLIVEWEIFLSRADSMLRVYVDSLEFRSCTVFLF